MKCNRPPPGWICTRDGRHDGPCAAIEDPIPQFFLNWRRVMERIECDGIRFRWVRAEDHEQRLAAAEHELEEQELIIHGLLEVLAGKTTTLADVRDRIEATK